MCYPGRVCSTQLKNGNFKLVERSIKINIYLLFVQTLVQAIGNTIEWYYYCYCYISYFSSETLPFLIPDIIQISITKWNPASSPSEPVSQLSYSRPQSHCQHQLRPTSKTASPTKYSLWAQHKYLNHL